ncbi:MAG TPA: DUF5666 domain-containing protein [Patescibacteria group bacterium]|nr:DUF5666 domain-containing protein [Patescibacteria group bacterium]
MKKITSGLLLLFLCVLSMQSVFAATTPTPTASVSQSEQQINNLKDRIASRVAQLNLVEKKGFIGTVSDVSETQITLTDMQGADRIVDVDELTKFSSPSAKSSFGISDISKGQLVGVIGLYNKDSRRLLARWIDVLKLPQIFSGAVLTVDKDNFTFTIATVDNQSIAIDVENITKTNAYTSAAGVAKSGFSKLSPGIRVLVVGFPDAKNKNLIVASRILVFPDLKSNPKITLINPTDIAPITPSTGSGKTLTPITK